jgi:hypothetical protein
MESRLLRFNLLVLLGLSIVGLNFQEAFAKSSIQPTPSPAHEITAPIDVERASLFHLLVYSQKGEMLLYPDLMDIVGTVKDEDINRLLQTTRSSVNTGEWFGWTSIGVVCSGVLMMTSSDSGTSNWGLGVFLGGIGLHITHDLFFDQAGTALFNAVERYNQSYWGDWDDSLRANKTSGLSPIHTHFSTLGGFEYQCAGKKLESDKDFSPFFESSNDFEVQRLFKDSQGSGTAGTILETVGGAGCVGSAVGYFSTNNSGDKTGCAWVFISSAVVGLVGDWFLKDAESSKFNAVQRYNRFARGQEAVLPKGPENEKDLLNFGSPDSKAGKNP